MYQKVENRALFKNSKAARDRLMEMGGVDPKTAGLGGMTPPPMPKGPQGIMASSPDLMQAAMRKAPVLPKMEPQPGMMMPQPAPAPAPQPPLPPSQPMPNIAGIAPVPNPQQSPRPKAQPQPPKAPAKKFNIGGDVSALGHYDSPLLREALAKRFGGAYKFGQAAITTEDPTKLGVPMDVAANLKKAKKEDPEEIAKALTKGVEGKDTKSKLKKILNDDGIKDIPENATVDQLNTAIAGAKLGAAIAGNVVNPNTGQALRPTAGARIGQAVAEGLAVKRDTAEKREAAAQAMKLQRLKNAGKSTTSKLSGAQKELVDLFSKRAETEDPAKVAEQFNQQFGEGVGDQLLAFFRSGALGPQPGGGETPSAPMTPIDKAREAIKRGAPRDQVIDRLKQAGIPTEGL